MLFKVPTFLLPIFFVFFFSQPRIDAARFSSDFEISDQRISDPKTSKFLFSTNVKFEDGGFNEKFYCLADCLKKASSDEENEVSDGKCLTGNSEYFRRLSHDGSSSNNVPQPNKTLSDQLLEYINLNAATKAAPFLGVDSANPHLPKNANDVDQKSYYQSINMPRPWWIVELGNTYKVVKITFYTRQAGGHRGVGVQFFVTDHVPFLCDGIPDITNLTVFGERATKPIETEKSDHEAPEGHFGSKVLVYKPAHNTFLEIAELQVAGYLYA